MEDTHSYNVKISRLEEYICAFDSVLDRIQKLIGFDDLKVYDHIVQVRDALFRLQQSMRGCEIVEFASSGLDDVVYENVIADLFWDRKKQRGYEDERDETLEREKRVVVRRMSFKN